MLFRSDLSAESPVFGSTAEFMRWKPESEDESSLTLRAIRLYQQLLQFHEADADQAAFLDTDLARLRFGYNKAFGEEKNSRYKAALVRFADEHVDSVISARALHELATRIYDQGQGDAVKAHQTATTISTARPTAMSKAKPQPHPQTTATATLTMPSKFAQLASC